jgi:HK97 family phage major capsid protein
MTMQYAAREFGRKDTSRADDHSELAAVMAALTKRDAEIQAFATKATAEIKDTGKIAAETKAALEKIAGEGSALQERMLAVEQKLARRGPAGPAVKSLGAQFVESDDFKALASKGRGIARMNVKTVGTITSDPNGLEDSPAVSGGAGAAIVPHRLPGILTPATRAFTIRDLILPGRTSSNSIEYVKEVGFNNSAAPVAEGAERAQSDLTLDLVTTPVRTVGHWFAASRQVLSDVPALMSYIDGRATYGLKLVEETQLLKGNGSGQNLHGLVPQAATFKQSVYSGSSDSFIDTIRRSILQCRVAEYAPSFVVLNPIDWCSIEMVRDSTGRYIMVPVPTNGADMRLWRLAVVETNAMTSGEFLVGATMGAQVFDREDAAIEVSTEHSDFFVKGLCAIKADERLALAVYRPESFVHGYFDLDASPSLND